MAATDYVTLEQLRLHMGLDVDDHPEWDTKLGNVITSVSAWIDEHCQRHFWQDVAATRSFDALTRRVVKLGHYNDLVSLTSLTVDGLEWDPSTYRLLRKHGDVRRPYIEIRAIGADSFPLADDRHVERVVGTGTWGWPSVPMQVPEACLIQSARIFKRKDAVEGVMGFAQFGVVRMQGRLDPDVAANLNNLIHPQAAVPFA